MRYHALAADYDGTLAHEGVIADSTTEALIRLKNSGRHLILVTGRELEDLLNIYPRLDVFDRVVAENGALAYRPETRESRILADSPSGPFVENLRRRGVSPLSVGRVIVATTEPWHQAALAAIRELGLELHVIFNKGSVMILPSGVNKATGLTSVLKELGLSPHNVVGIGDAENDHAFLSMCECSATVSNALPALRERADFIAENANGIGCRQLIDELLANDLGRVTPRLGRHAIHLGTRDDGSDEVIDPVSPGILVCGSSGSGKSTLTTGLLERFSSAGYQFVIVDPEGDYTSLDFTVTLGHSKQPPVADEIMNVLRDPTKNVVINLLGITLEHRPAYFDELLPRLLELRSRTGRPHWIVVDEAHHLLPKAREGSAALLSTDNSGMLFITVHPGSVSAKVLETVNTVLAVGGDPAQSLREYCDSLKLPAPAIPWERRLPAGDALLWRLANAVAVLVHTRPPKTERKRHSRKYAEGNLGADCSFYFRGPKARLNLKAQNLFLFLQLADGVDDETWEFHRQNHDYSGWFRDQIKDIGLADQVTTIESDPTLDPLASRAAVRSAIEERYTLPTEE